LDILKILTEQAGYGRNAVNFVFGNCLFRISASLSAFLKLFSGFSQSPEPNVVNNFPNAYFRGIFPVPTRQMAGQQIPLS
jgi:hypothetical protein